MRIKFSLFTKYIFRRILQVLPLIMGVIVLNFTIVHLAPGDPALYLAGEEADPEMVERLREKLGLDKSWIEQLILYLNSVLHGDLGWSYKFNRPVLSIILARLRPTLLLTMCAYIFSSTFGVLLGVVASKKPNSTLDSISSVISLIGYSMPMFWLAMILILVFSIKLDILPFIGISSLKENYVGIEHVIDVGRHLILPALTLGLTHLALIMRLTRANMLEVMGMDYIVTARSKGASEKRVLFKHGLKNAFLPVLTVIGMNIGALLGGSIVTETIFSWPGMGRLAYEAILGRDYPLLLGLAIMTAIMISVSNLIVEV